MGECQIPPTLVKTAGDFLIRAFTHTISSFCNKSSFLDLSKRVSIKPVNKGGTFLYKSLATECIKHFSNNRIVNI